jgi:uncharacterized protein (DUF1800 family)
MKLWPRPPAHPRVVSATPKSFAAALLACLCVPGMMPDLPALATSHAAAKEKKPKPDPVLKGLPVTELSADEAILHALNRLAYGPRPGDLERIRAMGEKGLASWIELQLNPDAIDDRAMRARLENYPTLGMSTAQLIEQYPQPKQAAKLAPGVPSGEGQTIHDGSPQPGAPAAPSSGGAGANAPRPVNAPASGTKQTAPEAGRRDAPGPADPNSVPRAAAAESKKPQRVVEELAMAKVIRAIYSERQLQQVMDDFWFNHFNIYAGKGEDRWYLTSYERDVIGPQALGRFRDLVAETAKSPAMLFYLDNFLSADPNAAQRQVANRAARQHRRAGFRRPWPPQPRQGQQAKRSSRGLNENYGRELMELHTLGVDGGYSQKDVTEVARCFTGWTIDKPREYPAFKFDEKSHDPEPKLVLGKKIHSGGIKDGEQVIDLLARHPSTAKFISTKLARRFVSDEPPASLVTRMASAFQTSDGDIRAVLRAMIYSPEFWSRQSYRAKIKTPFELVVSSVRVLGTDVEAPMPLVQWVNRIGEQLYQCQPPTGYADKADAWVNTGALLNRLNFSLALAGNRVRGARTDVSALMGTASSTEPRAALERGVQVFLGGQAAPATVETLEKQLENPQVVRAKLDDPVKQLDLGVVAGLVLGAPEFQRR